MDAPSSYLSAGPPVVTVIDGMTTTITLDEVWVLGQQRSEAGSGMTATSPGAGSAITTGSSSALGPSDSVTQEVPPIGSEPPTSVAPIGSPRIPDTNTGSPTPLTTPSPNPTTSPSSPNPGSADTSQAPAAPVGATTRTTANTAAVATGAGTGTATGALLSTATAAATSGKSGPGSLGAVPSGTFNRNPGAVTSTAAAARGMHVPYGSCEGSKARVMALLAVLGSLGFGVVVVH